VLTTEERDTLERC
jgi:transposase